MADVKPYKQVSKVQGMPLCHFDMRYEVPIEKSKGKEVRGKEGKEVRSKSK